MNKILMVEEEKSVVLKVEEFLVPAGYEIIPAYDGPHGFQMAKDKGPNLIITDAVVPGLSGYELCKAFKSDEETKAIPIVVMTENHRMEDSFMFLGIQDFLNKPLSMDELGAMVRKKLNFSQTFGLLKSKILINGRPEILSCCERLLKFDRNWAAYFSTNPGTFMEDAVKYAPDIVLIDLLLPGTAPDDLVKELKSKQELKNTSILTYYSTDNINDDSLAIQAKLIEVQYLRNMAEIAGAKEYLGVFNPVTFLNLINIYRRQFNYII